MCLGSYRSSGISELMRDAITTPAGFRICSTKEMKRKPITHKAAAERAAVIRRQNVQRHVKAAAVSKLREEIQRNTANRNMQMELGRLQGASLRHSGLDVPGLNWLHDLIKRDIMK